MKQTKEKILNMKFIKIFASFLFGLLITITYNISQSATMGLIGAVVCLAFLSDEKSI